MARHVRASDFKTDLSSFTGIDISNGAKTYYMQMAMDIDLNHTDHLPPGQETQPELYNYEEGLKSNYIKRHVTYVSYRVRLDDNQIHAILNGLPADLIGSSQDHDAWLATRNRRIFGDAGITLATIQ